MRIYAPVLICALDRYEHFRRCVESLLRCTGSQETDLYIALDYPLFETHWEGYRRIEEYLMEINGFKSVNIIRRSENYGVNKNFNTSRSEIFEKYDRIIISEDDNEFSINFLEYINKGLDNFENDDNIYAICGYNFPIKMPHDYKYNFYLKILFSGWGCAYWRHKYWEVPVTTTPLLKYINTVKDVIKLEKNGAYLLPGILHMIRTKKLFGDQLINVHLVQQNMFCVFPYISKVRNHGHDGTGENCREELNNIYLNQIIDENDTFFYNDMDPFIYDNNEIKKSLRKFYRRSFIKRAYTFLKYIQFRLMWIGNKI
jgi:hypothetical protein